MWQKSEHPVLKYSSCKTFVWKKSTLSAVKFKQKIFVQSHASLRIFAAYLIIFGYVSTQFDKYLISNTTLFDNAGKQAQEATSSPFGGG